MIAGRKKQPKWDRGYPVIIISNCQQRSLSRVQSQAFRLDGRRLSMLSHLAGPLLFSTSLLRVLIYQRAN